MRAYHNLRYQITQRHDPYMRVSSLYNLTCYSRSRDWSVTQIFFVVLPIQVIEDLRGVSIGAALGPYRRNIATGEVHYHASVP